MSDKEFYVYHVYMRVEPTGDTASLAVPVIASGDADARRKGEDYFRDLYKGTGAQVIDTGVARIKRSFLERAAAGVLGWEKPGAGRPARAKAVAGKKAAAKKGGKAAAKKATKKSAKKATKKGGKK